MTVVSDLVSVHRRVLLLETDERAGLVAALAAACAANEVSLEITTGPGHVIITFEADDPKTQAVSGSLRKVAGVTNLHTYSVTHP